MKEILFLLATLYSFNTFATKPSVNPSCNSIPENLHVCDYTNVEFKKLLECSDAAKMNEFVRNSICPNGSSDIDKEYGNPPRLNLSGTSVRDENGNILNNHFHKSVNYSISSIRGGIARVCFKPEGGECNKNLPPLVIKDILKSKMSLMPGNYEMIVTNELTGLQTSRSFTISGELVSKSSCLEQIGLKCNTKTNKASEFVVTCNSAPKGEGWVQVSKNRYEKETKSPCKGNSEETVSYVLSQDAKYSWTEVRSRPEMLSGDKPSTFYLNSKCSNQGEIQKDSSGHTWVCSDKNNTGATASYYKSCVHKNYINDNGDYFQKELVKGQSVITADAESLRNQEITCEEGQTTVTNNFGWGDSSVNLAFGEGEKEALLKQAALAQNGSGNSNSNFQSSSYSGGQAENNMSAADFDELYKTLGLDKVSSRQSDVGANSCKFVNFSDTKGKNSTFYLGNNEIVPRKIRANGKLVTQKIRCNAGQLVDVAYENGEKHPCEYNNYTAVKGTYFTTAILQENKTTARKIIENGKLVTQIIKCENNKIVEVDYNDGGDDGREPADDGSTQGFLYVNGTKQSNIAIRSVSIAKDGTIRITTK